MITFTRPGNFPAMVVAEFMDGELSMHPVIFTIVGIIILFVIAVAIMLIPEFVRYQKIRHM